MKHDLKFTKKEMEEILSNTCADQDLKGEALKCLNSILELKLKKAVQVIGGYIESPDGTSSYWYEKRPKVLPSTHLGRLVCIEKVEI